MVEVLAQWYMKLLSDRFRNPIVNSKEMEIVLEKFKSYGLRIEK